ncbi:LPS assembly lipoprotein LptE [Luteimonas fraxinea]|uniref:LPS-assembly lipoprotein LptE n=1 Tax=Luteimonas fraxinea TaxID=2901869 RepID=A0ABS8UIE4_9GAMM|nr:LPS assembly lipoprotein LptE [Luteimonas fraxinea]MCD9098448.1 LPS assembly lipoprotein LptE [Luteimonas fraxinea]MCD9127181.1 LPS assembly lipoprotein LptE [Luteimonas fraxinea]UHH10559.1 LPS assembly lipoprotein LptE [Luteimonas fraxinea]
MRILRPVFLPLALVALVLTLSACGFHLRNALTLPPNLGPVDIVSSDPYSRLARSVERALAAAGAEIAEPRATDVATLNIQSERWAALPASLDAQGRAQEYTLRYAVVFSMRDADGRDIVPQQAIELARDYLAPPTDSIGADSERELLSRELEREMTASIIRRIDAVFRNPQERIRE